MYSERIEGFGVEKAYYCPFIARKNNGLSWVPENLAFGFFYTPAGSEEAIAIELDDKGFVELKSRVEQARRTNSETFVFPGCPKPVRTVEAEQILVALSEAKSASSNNEFKPEKDSTATGPVERRGLVVKPNIEELDYEERRGALSIPSGLTPRLPGLLKPDFPLKPHQAEGVTWLQHLWSRSPSECRGALLADDMGLGKTLQLLTFIAAELELDHKLDPCLIVAPVYAIPKALKIAGLKVDQIDVIELNEAFAAQALSVIKVAGLDPARVNVNGGAVALGHPLGCTGAKLTATILREMERRNARYGHGDHVHRRRHGRGGHLRTRGVATNEARLAFDRCALK